MIKEEFFWFFVLPFFQNKQKIKKQSRDQNDLFINDGKYMKQKALYKFAFVSGETKGYFEKQ